jgi:hypothetical protein
MLSLKDDFQDRLSGRLPSEALCEKGFELGYLINFHLAVTVDPIKNGSAHKPGQIKCCGAFLS